MKKFALVAVAAALAATTFSVTAEAAQRWQHRGWNGSHHGWNHRGWNHGRWHGGRHYGYRHGWRGGARWGYWGGPRVVIGVPVYGRECFIKKVRRHDVNGHTFVKRVRVCR